jgi:hypothetical protein
MGIPHAQGSRSEKRGSDERRYACSTSSRVGPSGMRLPSALGARQPPISSLPLRPSADL